MPRKTVASWSAPRKLRRFHKPVGPARRWRPEVDLLLPAGFGRPAAGGRSCPRTLPRESIMTSTVLITDTAQRIIGAAFPQSDGWLVAHGATGAIRYVIDLESGAIWARYIDATTRAYLTHALGP